MIIHNYKEEYNGIIINKTVYHIVHKLELVEYKLTHVDTINDVY